MKIFILEDDSSCKGIIDWIRGNHDVVTAVDNIENASYFLEYQEEYRNYDKFIIDASLPAAKALYLDGTETEYYGAMNGIDYMLDNFPKFGIDLKSAKVVILTAFATKAKSYLKEKTSTGAIRIIDKNDAHLKNRLQEFLGT